MNKNCIKYKDTSAAPGSKLHEALLAKDMKAAERIYQECEKASKELVKPK